MLRNVPLCWFKQKDWCAALLGLLLTFASPTQGNTANLSVQATLVEQGIWNSNPLLLEEEVEALWGSTTIAGLTLKNTTPASQALLSGSAKKNIFNQSGFNSDDGFFASSFSRQNQRWKGDLTANLSYDTTRTSEETSYGNRVAGVRHWGAGINPEISFSLDKTHQFGLTGSFTNDSYDDTDYTGYTVFSLTPSYTRIFDPLNKGSFLFIARRYETRSGPKKIVESLSPSLGWTHIFTPKLSAKAFVGAQASREKGDSTTERDWTLQSVFSADLTFRGTQDTFDLIATRSQKPFANGTEPLTTSLTLQDTHRIHENLLVNGSINYQFAEYPEEVAGERESLTTADASLVYSLTETLDLSAKYKYRFETLTQMETTVDDHAGTLSVIFRPKTWTLGL